MKLVKVVPLFKAADSQDPSKYRPIPVLPTLNKSVERIFHTRPENFLETAKQINRRQFGFWKQLSTIYALISTRENIRNHLKNNMHVACAFLDLSKAFDTVNHIIL